MSTKKVRFFCKVQLCYGKKLSTFIFFTLLLISLANVRIKDPLSKRLPIILLIDNTRHKKNKNQKLSTSGGNAGIVKVKVQRVHGFVPSRGFHQACTRTALACAGRFCVHLGTDSVRSKIPPLCVPVSPSPVSCEAGRDLWRSIRPSTMGVFQLQTSVQCVRKHIGRFNVHIYLKTSFKFPTLETRRGSSDGGSVQRGRKKAEELHTSGAK